MYKMEFEASCCPTLRMFRDDFRLHRLSLDLLLEAHRGYEDFVKKGQSTKSRSLLCEGAEIADDLEESIRLPDW